MAREDQRPRKLGYQNTKVDKLNVKELKTIIKRYGWPITSLVGKNGAEAAWLIAQHATDIHFQKSCLKLIKKAAESNSVPRHHIAYLTDRILVRSKKPQIFGTQFYIKNGKASHCPTKDDLKNLDKRRREYNLPPFKIYKKLFLKLNAKNRKSSKDF